MKHFVRSLFVLFLFSVVTFAQEPNWNQFRGPKRDNHSFSTGIAKPWSEGGPKLLWKINTIGNGYSNVSFFGDMMFTMGDVGNQCLAFALDRNTGKEIWKQPIGRAGGGLQGDGSKEAGHQSSGPLATPACDGEAVYVCSQYGDFVALNMKDGKELWRKNIFKDMGANIMGSWAFSPSPVLDSGKILLQIGGDGGTLAAFDKSGKLLWRTDWLQGAASYTSPVPVDIEGVHQYLLLASERLVGVSPDGQFLWGTDFPGKTAVCSDPVLCGDVVIASCSYNVGTYFYRVTKDGAGFKEVSSFNGPIQSLISHHGGIVAVGDHFYLLTNNNLACVEAKTGNTVWENRSVGKGSLVYVDGVLILRSERGDGTISMVEAAPLGYKELGRFDPPDRSDKNSWTYPVVVDKKLYLRDQNVLLCYDLK